MKDIKAYNKIKKFEKPNYKVNTSTRDIVVSFFHDGKLGITAYVDNNYIYWHSVTTVKNDKINTEIFNHICNKDYDFSMGYGSSYDYKQSYKKVIGNHYEVHFDLNIEKMEVTSLSAEGYSHKYSDSWVHNGDVIIPPGNSSNWGKFFVNDIRSIFNFTKEKCKFRELDGKYLQTLKHYRRMLTEAGYDNEFEYEGKTYRGYTSDPVEIYHKFNPLSKIINEESYILCSDNEEIRETYLNLKNDLYSIYCTYMSIVR